jgi:hypothetical protein
MFDESLSNNFKQIADVFSEVAANISIALQCQRSMPKSGSAENFC